MKRSLFIAAAAISALLIVATYSGFAYADATQAPTTSVDGIVAFACASNGAALKWFLLLFVPLVASLATNARKYLPAPLVVLLEAFSGDFVNAFKVWVAHKAAQSAPPSASIPPKS